MKRNKKPKLFFLLAPIASVDGEKGQGKAEGGDEVDRSLLDRALAKLGRTEVTIDGYQGEMDKEEKTKK